MERGATQERFLPHMTRSAVEEFLHEYPDPVVLVSIGSIEQHGPHLPLGTDSLSALELCLEAARRVPALVVQPCWAGCSEHHMGFPGTVSIREETLVAVLVDTGVSLCRHGMRRQLLVNFHGGNNAAVDYAVGRLRHLGAQAVVARYPGPPGGGPMAELETLDLHSGRNETAFILATRPDLVEEERLREWRPSTRLSPELDRLRQEGKGDPELAVELLSVYLPPTHELTNTGIYGLNDPRFATAEEGRQWFDAVVGYLVRLVRMWDRVAGACRKYQE